MSLIYYSEEEDNNKEESINKYKDLFLDYEKKLPTLSEALNQMFISAGANTKKSKKNMVKKLQKKIHILYVHIHVNQTMIHLVHIEY